MLFLSLNFCNYLMLISFFYCNKSLHRGGPISPAKKHSFSLNIWRKFALCPCKSKPLNGNKLLARFGSKGLTFRACSNEQGGTK